MASLLYGLEDAELIVRNKQNFLGIVDIWMALLLYEFVDV